MILYLTNIVCPKLFLYDLVLTQPCVFSSFGVYDIRLSAIDELSHPQCPISNELAAHKKDVQGVH